MALSNACMANLRDLSSLSKTINEKSDDINRVIQEVEETLAKFRLGVEAWLEADPLFERSYREVDLNGIPVANCKMETHLGYARRGEGFALVIRDVHFVKERDSLGIEEWRVEDEGDPKLLRQATRTIRVQALPKLEALFDVMKEEAEKTIQSIERGKKAVEGLRAESGNQPSTADATVQDPLRAARVAEERKKLEAMRRKFTGLDLGKSSPKHEK